MNTLLFCLSGSDALFTLMEIPNHATSHLPLFLPLIRHPSVVTLSAPAIAGTLSMLLRVLG